MADLRKAELFPADAFGLFYLQITRIPGGWHRHAEYEIFYHMHSKIPSEISDSTVRALRGFLRVMKRRSDLEHSVFVLRNRECDQEVNQSKCKAETGPADKQVEDKSCCSVFRCQEIEVKDGHFAQFFSLFHPTRLV